MSLVRVMATAVVRIAVLAMLTIALGTPLATAAPPEIFTSLEAPPT